MYWKSGVECLYVQENVQYASSVMVGVAIHVKKSSPSDKREWISSCGVTPKSVVFWWWSWLQKEYPRDKKGVFYLKVVLVWWKQSVRTLSFAWGSDQDPKERVINNFQDLSTTLQKETVCVLSM